MRTSYIKLLLVAALATAGFGQTLVDLRTQSKSPDFSALASTSPVQVGTALPATCQVGQLFFNQAAAAGANLFGCTATNIWTLQSGGTSSGGGASMASQLGDLLVVRTATNVLTIGANCSTATPCNVHVGSIVYPVTASATATLSGTASGMAYVYVTASGVLTVGHNLTLACSTGCVAQAGVTAFPVDSVPLGTWSATSGTFDLTGGHDYRAFLGTKSVVAGQGIVTSDSGGAAVVSVDTTQVGLLVAVPATSSAACQTGSWSYDVNYFYVCIASNTWRRAAVASW